LGIAQPPRRSFLTFLTSLSATSYIFRKPRLRFDDFFSRLWLRIPCRRRSFPVPVTLKRFFAPFPVFIFGICLHSCVLRRRENHDHVATVEKRLLLDCPELLHVLGEPHEQVPTTVRVQRVAPAEHDRDLYLGPLAEKAHHVPLLGLVVVDPDLRSELDLLDLDLLLVLAGLLRTLVLLVAVLRVVHDPRDGRIRSGRDLHEIEALAVCELERFLRREDPDLSALFVDETDALRADLLVDSLVPLARYLPVEIRPTAARSQRPFIKLSASSL